MPYEVNIDMEKFCRLYVDGMDSREAYKEAGYVQEGRTDNSKRLASRYLQRQDVQKTIRGMQQGVYEDLKQWSLAAMKNFAETDYHALPPKDKMKFVTEMMNITGQSAAKRVDISGSVENKNVNIQLDNAAIASHLLALTEVNPHVTGIISQAVGQSEAGSIREDSE